MKKKDLALLTLCSFLFLPTFSFADINLDNETDSFGTGKFGGRLSPCSSMMGEEGIVHPHQSDFKIPQDILNTLCKNQCEGHIFMTKNCSGQEVATFTMTKGDGVIKIDNHAPDKFIFTGSGQSVVVKPVTKTLHDWLKFLF